MFSLLSPISLFKVGILFSPMSIVSLFHKITKDRIPKNYLQKTGVMRALVAGDPSEIKAVWADLYRIHRLIRSRRPRVVLEFGVGYSTIVIAHALKMNGNGHLHTVDTSKKWIGNTAGKLKTLGFEKSVSLHHSRCFAATHDGQLTCQYETLPNIDPDFIYLDGPTPHEVEGNVRNLSFSLADNEYRHVTASDILLFEPTLRVGCFVLVDARYCNVQFLRHNLRRNWKIHWDRVRRQVGFELREITGRSFRIKS